MSLSQFCVEQHEQEQARLRRLLLFGLLGSIGMHAIAFGLSSLGIGQRNAQAELSPIELLVMAPPPEIEEPPEVDPAELSNETRNPAPNARAHTNPESVAAPPPQPAELFQPEPQPIPETNIESQLTEPENTEEPEATSEAITATTDELDAPQIEPLRDFFERAPETDPDATSTDKATATGTDETSPSIGNGKKLLLAQEWAPKKVPTQQEMVRAKAKVPARWLAKTARSPSIPKVPWTLELKVHPASK
jgi:outer membrane biosynthesis protein TonB